MTGRSNGFLLKRRYGGRRWAGVRSGAITFTLLLTSMWISSAPASGASSGTSGTVTIGYDLTGVSTGEPVFFDPTLSKIHGEQNPWTMAIYSTLLRPTPSGAVKPELATSVAIVNPETVTIQLRKGIVFSDGTPFNAQAVMDGLLRNKSDTAAFSPLQAISTIDVVNPYSLTVHLSGPDAGEFYGALSDNDAFIASPTAVARGNVNTDPIGAGPFVLKQYVPNSSIVLVRNPKYWDASSIHIRELKYVNVPAGPQQINAVESGLVDVGQIPVADLPAVRSNSSFNVVTATAQSSTLWLPTCKSQAPLSSVQVRRALSFAIDRNAINRAVLNGTGQPQWALWPKGSIFFPTNLNNYYAYNPKKAKQLLSKAGYPHGFSVTLVYLTGNPSSEQTATIIQSEWKQIGVHVALFGTSNIISDFYTRHVGPMAVNTGILTGLNSIAGPYTPGHLGNICNYDSPYIDAILNKLNALPPTSSASVALWDQVQNYIVKNALSMWVAYEPDVFASKTSVGGVQFLVNFPLPVPYYWSLFLR